MKQIKVKIIEPTPLQVTFGANKVLVTNRKCVVCGNKFYHGKSTQGQVAGKNSKIGTQVDNNCCLNCQFWSDTFMTDFRNGDAVIINREHYRLNDSGMFNFGGQEFTIEYEDGRRIVTRLGHQGTIPEEFADAMPDNAKFVETA